MNLREHYDKTARTHPEQGREQGSESSESGRCAGASIEKLEAECPVPRNHILGFTRAVRKTKIQRSAPTRREYKALKNDREHVENRGENTGENSHQTHSDPSESSESAMPREQGREHVENRGENSDQTRSDSGGCTDPSL